MRQDGSRHIPAEMEIVFDGCRKSAIAEDQTLFHVLRRFGVRNETLDLIKENIDTIRKVVGGRRPKSLQVIDARWAEDSASNQCEHHSTTPSATPRPDSERIIIKETRMDLVFLLLDLGAEGSSVSVSSLFASSTATIWSTSSSALRISRTSPHLWSGHDGCNLCGPFASELPVFCDEWPVDIYGVSSNLVRPIHRSPHTPGWTPS
jgi:hypothetical protein